MHVARPLLSISTLVLGFLAAGINTPVILADLPPAPAATAPMSPEESLRAFKAAPGFHVELVASEPLIDSPVALTFDTDGRIWVCEMRGYMPDVDGTGEDQPTGRIVILQDTDGDGKMDKSTVFADGLVLPRSLAFCRDGLLVAEPPKLWLYGPPGPDGRATGRTQLLANFSPKGGQPEYQPNGLLRAIDNWIYNALGTARYRFDATGKLQTEPTIPRGQWGIAQDDEGRLFYNYNGDQLRGDAIPAEYLRRNPDLHDPAGVNLPTGRNQTVFPARVNRSVNRAYEKKVLRADGTLRTYTASCGPTIYRGDLFAPEYRGNAFICEPAGNLVRRGIITWQDCHPALRNAYEGSEFLTSTDERFRPVSLYTGPDGALYVVDVHRGLLQHKAFLSGYLRDETLARSLDKPTDQGRIYRVVPDGVKAGALPRLQDRSPAALIARLNHPNGWWRDTAQRLLVENRSDAAVIPLRELAASDQQPALGRLHALWTLQGMDKLDRPVLASCLSARDPALRAAAVRLSEGVLLREPSLLGRVRELTADSEDIVRLQAVLSLGEVRDAQTASALTAVLLREAANPILRDGVISGLRGRELEWIDALMASPAALQATPGFPETLGVLARCVLEERNPGRVGRLCQIAAAQTGKDLWKGQAIVAGLADAAAAHKRRGGWTNLRLDHAPTVLLASSGGGPGVGEHAERAAALFDWPGKPAPASVPKEVDLDSIQRTLVERGKPLFEQTCGACHQETGLGLEGLAPPLVGSPWVVGSEKRLVRIALHGLTGGVNVNGREFNMEMPPMGSLSDDDLAAILTYIRRRWGNSAAPVEPGTINRIRRETETHTASWSIAELLRVP